MEAAAETTHPTGGRGSFWYRREARSAPDAAPDAVARFRDPGPVSSQRAYRHSLYKASQVSLLLSRYTRIRGDLLMAWPGVRSGGTDSQREAGVVCADLLREARSQLEARRVMLTSVANLLSLSERALVSLYGADLMRYRLHTLRNRLRGLDDVPHAEVENLCLAISGLRQHRREQVETAVKDALTYLSEQDEKRLIEDDLQVSRLTKAVWYVGIGWLLLLAIVPFVSSVQRGSDGQLIWPVRTFASADWFDLMFGAVSLSVVGAVGGVVSGMLTVRGSSTTLQDYRRSLKWMTLKPLFGAIAAVVMYFFLSSGVVNGVGITTPGPYIVAAFLVGFSERYFLSFLDRSLEAPPAEARRPDQSRDRSRDQARDQASTRPLWDDGLWAEDLADDDAPADHGREPETPRGVQAPTATAPVADPGGNGTRAAG
ncbi:hypothetical protein E8D34_01380 [Nocardioides sp. GY 10113]|uniref:hypothetical protein n=1 Tax=Nocardioides sp. GY 10113 TaxID=2569761 RepID=UPI0010A8A1B6|nr:hypothetical protein [Nocardioides sp. GY 10113]TIC89178.1 hypothetical protein E8D34_01380 [Nocardioides sp. GY 10113]